MSFLRQASYALLISFVSYNIAGFLVHFGANVKVYNYVPGECSVLTVSDEEIYATDFVTLNHRILFPYVSASKKTGFFTFESKNKSAVRLASTDKSLQEFTPGGIAVWDRKLFVVNHRAKEDTVEVLSVSKDNGIVKHLSTVRSKKFNGLRDIAAVDKNKFFATSWREEPNEFKRFYEEYLSSPTGAVLFFDGSTVRYVDRKISSPYGIVYDQAQKTLYVASYSTQNVIAYSVSQTYSIKRKGDIRLHSSPSLMWQGLDRSLIVSTHPIRYRSLFHRLNETRSFSPSLVLRVHTSFTFSENPRIDTMYANDGATMSAATSVIVAGSSLLMSGGNIPILSCKLQPYVSFSLS